MAEVSSFESTEGYLYKCGGNGKSWKRRYFKLCGNEITYYNKRKDCKVRQTIQLEQARGVREMSRCRCEWPPTVTEEYGFGLATLERTYYLYSSQEDGTVSTWKSKIQAMIEINGQPDDNWREDKEGKKDKGKILVARRKLSKTKGTEKTHPKRKETASSLKEGSLPHILEAQQETMMSRGLKTF